VEQWAEGIDHIQRFKIQSCISEREKIHFIV